VQKAEKHCVQDSLRSKLYVLSGTGAALYALGIFYLSFIPNNPKKLVFEYEFFVEAFSRAAFFETDFIVNLLVMIPLGLILGFRLLVGNLTTTLPSLLLRILPLCITLSLVSESSQLFVKSRVLSINDLVAQVSGAVLGVILARYIFQPRLLEFLADMRVELAKAGSCRILTYLVLPTSLTYAAFALFYSWGTILPHLDANHLSTGFDKFLQLPFLAMMSGSYFEAARNCSFAFLSLLPLGLLMNMPVGNLKSAYVLFFGGLLSLAMELGQVIFGTSYPDISVSLILFTGFFTGAIVSWLLFTSVD